MAAVYAEAVVRRTVAGALLALNRSTYDGSEDGDYIHLDKCVVFRGRNCTAFGFYVANAHATRIFVKLMASNI